MRLAFPVSALLASISLLAGCSGGLPEGANGSDSSTVPGASSSPPSPAFRVSADEGVAPFSVGFEQLDSSGTTAWTWDFGDGAECTSELGGTACAPEPFAPVHTYSSPGVFTVTLTARGPGGTRVARIEDAVEVRPMPPLADFAVDTTGGILPLSVTFTNQSSNATSFAWTFGDGGTSTAQSPTHVYTQFGSFAAVLRATGPGGNSEATRSILVQAPPPDPRFEVQIDSVTVPVAAGPLPLFVRFVQTNSEFTTARVWEFGEGNSSTAVTPLFLYSVPGLFDPRLNVTGPGGSASLVRDDVVEAFDELLDGSFENQTSGQIPSGAWTPFSGILGGLGHRILPFSSPLTDLGMPTNGSRWCLISSQSSDGSTPPSNPGGVTSPGVGGAGIRQDFTYRNGQSRLRFDAVFMTNETPGTATFRDWASVDVFDGSTTRNLFFRNTQSTFGGGDSATLPGTQSSTILQSVSVDLAVLFPGSTVGTRFTLIAQAGNVGGGTRESFLFLDNARLEIIANPVVANFTAAPLNANLNQNVVFTDTSTGNPSSWAWDFGDGGASTAQNPVRPYTVVGPRTIRLTASKPGSSDALTRPDFVNVFGAPNSSFTAAPLSGRAPLLVTLDNTSTNVAGVTYLWDFGDGVTSTQIEPGNHVFRNTGTTTISRTIVLTARTPTNPEQVVTSQRVVQVGPEARFGADIYPILSGATCVNCHNAPPTNGNINFTLSQSSVHSTLTTVVPACAEWNSTHSPDRYVIGGQLGNSFLWRKVGENTLTPSSTPCIDRVMPTSGPDSVLIGLLRSWIDAGAPNN